MQAPPARGLLRTRAPDRANQHQRVLPSPALAPWIAHFWWVRWSLDAPFLAETLPHPTVHVVFEGRRARVTGIPRGRFVRRLAGDGEVFGIKFRPAAFPFPRPPADRTAPMRAAFGAGGARLARAIREARGLDERIAIAEAFLAPRLLPLAPEVATLRDLVERMAIDRAMLRVDDAAAALDVDRRTLERRFRRHVGVTPKWVLARYRLHEAAERLRGQAPPSLASLAAELGYADQAHFSRDWKAVVGVSPRAFLGELNQAAAPTGSYTSRR